MTDEQKAAWQACVDYAREKKSWALLTALEEGPDETTNFAGLLAGWRQQDAQKPK